MAKKRHAVLVSDPRRVLHVNDDEDWQIIRQAPRPALKCPEDGCAKQLDSALLGDTRYLRHKRNDPGCPHWLPHDGGGGDMTPEHRWLTAHVAAIVRKLGLTAIVEHPHTRADVYVEELKLAIELQRVATSFEQRTQSRSDKGAETLWLITNALHTKTARRFLFGSGAAVRYYINGPGAARGLFQPWNAPAELAKQARLFVGATTTYLIDEPPFIERGGAVPFEEFLRARASGVLRWTQWTSTKGTKSGWVTDAVLAESRSRAGAHARDVEARTILAELVAHDRQQRLVVLDHLARCTRASRAPTEPTQDQRAAHLSSGEPSNLARGMPPAQTSSQPTHGSLLEPAANAPLLARLWSAAISRWRH